MILNLRTSCRNCKWLSNIWKFSKSLWSNTKRSMEGKKVRLHYLQEAARTINNKKLTWAFWEEIWKPLLPVEVCWIRRSQWLHTRQLREINPPSRWYLAPLRPTTISRIPLSFYLRTYICSRTLIIHLLPLKTQQRARGTALVRSLKHLEAHSGGHFPETIQCLILLIRNLRPILKQQLIMLLMSSNIYLYSKTIKGMVPEWVSSNLVPFHRNLAVSNRIITIWFCLTLALTTRRIVSRNCNSSSSHLL